MLRTKKIRAVNPHRPTAKKNPPTLVTLGVLNPRRFKMAKKKKASPKKSHSHRKNPSRVALKAAKKSYKKISNPNLIKRLVSKPIEIATAGAGVIAGLVATQQVPQMLLKEKNTGGAGYLANLAVSIGGAWLLGKWNPLIGLFFGAGGGAYIVGRVINEQLGPIGGVLAKAGIGDYTAAGVLGSPRIGPLQDNFYINPTPRTVDGRAIIPNRLQPPPAMTVVAPAMAGRRAAM